MRTGGGNFPLRSPWIGVARRRRKNHLLVNAFTIDGNTAQKAVWTDYFFDASGPITLQPSLLTNTQSFFAPLVGQGAVAITLQPSLLTNTQSFFAPLVGRGAITLQPSLLTNTQSFFAPLVGQGAVALSPDLLTNTQSFFAPLVGRGAITLQPSLLTNVQFFFDHTIGDVLGDVVATFSTGLASSSAVVAAVQFSASTSAMDVEITG